MKMIGRAWKFGDNISTDQIAPGRYFHLRFNLQELAKHVLEDARKDFASGIQKEGGFIVAGRNFGLGSSREQAPLIIKIAGTKAILAKSFARIFYRNAINIGLPLIICNTDAIDDGDELEVDLSAGKVKNLTKGIELSFPPLPDVMMKILNEGGLLPYLKKYGDLPVG
ncbi:MAG: 3-isopropylmalate dehydratase small subunit [Nitrososphaerales archaeon]|nr:3-isopropylmalate dehydratase small subunit [Nitrososphaerales archaeon]